MCPSLVVTPLLHSPPLPFVSAAEERAGEMLANYPPRPGLLPPSVCLVLLLLQCCQGGLFFLPIFATIPVTFFLFIILSHLYEKVRKKMSSNQFSLIKEHFQKAIFMLMASNCHG